jgi:hypothetical protein
MVFMRVLDVRILGMVIVRQDLMTQIKSRCLVSIMNITRGILEDMRRFLSIVIICNGLIGDLDLEMFTFG